MHFCKLKGKMQCLLEKWFRQSIKMQYKLIKCMMWIYSSLTCMPPPSLLLLNQSLKSRGDSSPFSLPCSWSTPALRTGQISVRQRRQSRGRELGSCRMGSCLLPLGFRHLSFTWKGNECPSNLISDTEFGTLKETKPEMWLFVGEWGGEILLLFM